MGLTEERKSANRAFPDKEGECEEEEGRGPLFRVYHRRGMLISLSMLCTVRIE